MKPIFRICILIILVLSLLGGNFQKIQASAEPAEWTSYVNANNIIDLSVGPDGYLWAASPGGITKWNIKTKEYEFISTSKEFPSNDITTILADRDGSVWVGTRGGRIAQFKDNQWHYIILPELKSGMWIFDIHQDKKGNVWFATYGAGAIRFDGKDWRVFLLEDGIASLAVKGIAEDNLGNLWFDTFIPCCDSMRWDNFDYSIENRKELKSGISRFDGKSWKTYISEFSLNSDDYYGGETNVAVNGSDLWLSPYANSVIRYSLSNGNVEKFPFEDDEFTRISDIQTDTNENVFINFYGENGLLKFTGSEWVQLTTKDGLASDNVTSMSIGSDGAMWLGTPQGISLYKEGKWEIYETSDKLTSLPCNNVNDLVVATNGIVWVASDEGVCRLDSKGWIIFSLKDGLSSNNVERILITSKNIVWINVTFDDYYNKKHINDIYSYDDSKWTRQNIPIEEVFFDISETKILREINWDNRKGIYDKIGMAISKQGKIWRISVAYPDYLSLNPDFVPVINIELFNGQSWDQISKISGINNYDPKSTLITQDGALWFSGLRIGVFKYLNGEWSNYQVSEGLAGNSVTKIAEAPDGSLWFVSAAGLTHFTGNH